MGLNERIIEIDISTYYINQIYFKQYNAIG